MKDNLKSVQSDMSEGPWQVSKIVKRADIAKLVGTFAAQHSVLCVSGAIGPDGVGKVIAIIPSTSVKPDKEDMANAYAIALVGSLVQSLTIEDEDSLFTLPTAKASTPKPRTKENSSEGEL